jgi:hypothetical protein
MDRTASPDLFENCSGVGEVLSRVGDKWTVQVVVVFLPLLLIPDPGPRIADPQENGDDVAAIHQKSEAILRGARMLRTALGPAIARFWKTPRSSR